MGNIQHRMTWQRHILCPTRPPVSDNRPPAYLPPSVAPAAAATTEEGTCMTMEATRSCMSTVWEWDRPACEGTAPKWPPSLLGHESDCCGCCSAADDAPLAALLKAERRPLAKPATVLGASGELSCSKGGASAVALAGAATTARGLSSLVNRTVLSEEPGG